MSHTSEHWSRLDVFPDYEVSTEGNVRRFYDRYPMRTRLDRCGYRRLNLIDYLGETQTVQVHRLVADAFLGSPDRVYHIGERTDNRLCNLSTLPPRKRANYSV